MTSCIKSAFARRRRLLTLRNRFASLLFVIKEELRRTWKFWIARGRCTAPSFHSQVRKVTNFAAWSNCIGHSEGGGSSDLGRDIIAKTELMTSQLDTSVGLLELN